MKLTSPLLLIACVFSITTANAGDWPRWRGPDANGISKETGWSTEWPAEGPKVLWKTKIATGFSSFAVSSKRVFTMGNEKDNDIVYCLDADTGKEIWRFSYPCKLDPNLYEGGPNATPTVDGDRVYTFGREGQVYAFDAAKGSVVWTKNLMTELQATKPEWGFSGSVLVEGDLCAVNAGTAGVALDKKTGKVVWSSGTEITGYCTPVPFDANGQKAVMMTIKQDIIAVNVKDGKEIWRFPWKTQYNINAADPIKIGDKVFISSGYDHGCAVFDVASNPPKELWKNKNMRNQFSSSVVWNGYVYGMDESQLRCLSLETGEAKWAERATRKGSLMLADGKLIVLGERGELIIAETSPEAFKPIARAQIFSTAAGSTSKCWTPPVLANGRIYCRNAVGEVVCVDVAK
jgi:outer membrane protein assembly factor BamB